MQARAAQFDIDVDRDILKLVARGDWRARHLGPIDAGLRDFEDDSAGRDIIIDVSGVDRLDTAGAMLLEKCRRDFVAAGRTVEEIGVKPDFARLIERVEIE